VSERPIHDRLEELLAVDAMDGLDDDGRRELHELLTWHDSQCPECARFRREFAEVSAAMAMSLDPVPMSAGAEERLMTATRMPRTSPLSGDVVQLDEAREERERRRGPAKVAVALLTAAACLVGAGVVGFVLRSPSSGSETAIASFEAGGPTEKATLEKGDQEVTVYYHPGQDAALVVGDGMQDPPAGHMYELWYQPQGQSTMSPAGTFTPNDGDVVAPARVETPFTTLAVSVEEGYETSPHGEVVLTEHITP
jgi:hypothetical protein